MPCRRLSVEEYQNLLPQIENGTIKSYDTEGICQGRCCESSGCCQEMITISRCYRDEDLGVTMKDWIQQGRWNSGGGDPWQQFFRRCVGKINGGCTQSDFTPPITCSAYRQVCDDPNACYTDCVRYETVCQDPNDPDSCYQDCVEYGQVCPCYDVCTSYEGAIPPCTSTDGEGVEQQSPRYYSNWVINSQGCQSCCNGECPMSPGVPCGWGACCRTGQTCLEFSTPEQCTGTHHPGKFCWEVCP